LGVAEYGSEQKERYNKQRYTRMHQHTSGGQRDAGSSWPVVSPHLRRGAGSQKLMELVTEIDQLSESKEKQRLLLFSFVALSVTKWAASLIVMIRVSISPIALSGTLPSFVGSAALIIG